MKKTNFRFTVSALGVATIGLFTLFSTTALAVENESSLSKNELSATGGVEIQYTPEQQAIMDQLEENVEKYEEYGDSAPLVIDPKAAGRTRAAAGSWSWRDGVICVTDAGSSLIVTNSWHAGIVAPQANYVVAEAEGVGKTVRLRSGDWGSAYPKNKVWQVGVKSTSVAQDLAAGRWAGNQKGKPYNLNFWNIKQTGSFYCSQLPWAAYYYTANVDLDKSDNNLGSAKAVHPGEFVDNSKTVLIYRNK